jgi:hypothetical protein
MTDSLSSDPSEPQIVVVSGKALPAAGNTDADAATTPEGPSAEKPNGWCRGRSTAIVLTLTSAILFAVGIFAPSFTMIPKLGNGYFEWLVRRFVASDLEPRSFSLVGGTIHLFRGGDLFVGTIILAFSVIFPAAKLTALGFSLPAKHAAAERYLGLLEQLGKWSMLDVFVIATLVVCFKGFPGGSHVEVEWGIYVFAASVILSMFATRAMRLYHSAAPTTATNRVDSDCKHNQPVVGQN